MLDRMLCLLLVIEFSFLTSQISSKDIRNGYDENLDSLTNEILLYMRKRQLTKSWWPSWTITPVDDMPLGRVGAFSLQSPMRVLDSELKSYKKVLGAVTQNKTTMNTPTKKQGEVNTTTTPLNSTTASTTALTTASTTVQTTVSTTQSPMAEELNEYMSEKRVGMFTAFLIKLLKIIRGKRPEELKPIFDVFAKHLSVLSKDGRMFNLRDEDMVPTVIQYTQSLNVILTLAQPHDVQQRAAVILKMIEEQDGGIAPDYSLLNSIDQMFQYGDAAGMIKALQHIHEFPGNGIPAAEVTDAVIKILLIPFQRSLSRKRYEDVKMRADLDNITHSDVLDKNEAKLLTNDWNYKKDGIPGLFGNIQNNYHTVNEPTGVSELVRRSALDRFESKWILDKNRDLNKRYVTDMNKNKGAERFREQSKGNARRIKRRKFSKDKIYKFNKTKLETNKVRSNMHTIGNVEQKLRRKHLKQDNTGREEVRRHILKYNSHKRSTKPNKNAKKLNEQSENITRKVIHSDEGENTNLLSNATSNGRRKININIEIKKGKSKGFVKSLQVKLFNALKGENGRKFFTKTTRKGLSQVSSESDEEVELRNNIYKAIGVHNDFDKVKMI